MELIGYMAAVVLIGIQLGCLEGILYEANQRKRMRTNARL